MTGSGEGLAARLKAGLLPLAMLLLLGTLWGLAFSLGKFAALGNVSGLSFVFWQGIGAGALLLVFSALRGELSWPTPRVIVYAVTAGGIGVAIPNVNSVNVLHHVPAGLMAIIVITVPLMTTALSAAIGLERPGRRELFGIALGFAGTLLIVLPGAALPDPDDWIYSLLALITPIGYSVSNVIIQRFRPSGVPSPALGGFMLVGVAGTVAPIMVATGAFHPLWPPFQAADIAILVQMLLQGSAYILYLELMRTAGIVYASQVGYVVTATGIAWGMVLFGEVLSPSIWGAGALIAVGLLIVNGARAKA